MIAYLDQRRRLLPDPSDGGDSATDFDFDCAGESEEEAAAREDFGGLVRTRPLAVVRPGSADDVARAVRLSARRMTVAARGNGHSVAGQAMADGGIVLDMRAMAPRRFELVVDGSSAESCADVPGGALWEELLHWAVATHGLAPVSWTDYLRLTVGGTLSNGGISGQAFRHGPQISQVREMEIVTGDGEVHVCSPSSLPDLFFAALGGLGQFGIITRARIPLHPAPPMVKWMRVVYAEFGAYARDAEWLVSRSESDAFDYIEGFAFVNRDDPVDGWGAVPLGSGSGRFDPALVPADSGPVLYCLEVALHYHHRDSADKRASEMLRPLSYVRGLEFTAHVSYMAFLSRVKSAEEEARANGSWHAPHPWLNLLVSAADIAGFDRHVFKRILRNGIGGPMLVYPMLRSKWDLRASVALPESEVFYLVALLRFSRPFPDGPPVDELLAQNREIVACCESNGYDYKLYLPHYESEEGWARHFGKAWPRFVERKARYDPMAILAPGQKIFSRAPLQPL